MSFSDRLLKRFSRVTTSGRFIPEIDGARFIAILLVIVFHVAVYTEVKLAALRGPTPASLPLVLARQGHYGVQLFFVVSGFILAMPFAAHRLKGQRPVELKHYFLRRVTRLEPPYVLSLILVGGLLLAAHKDGLASLLRHLGASLTYTHNLAYGEHSTINNVAWSLEIEIQFYLLAPVMALVFVPASRWVRRGIVAVACLAAIVGQALFIPSPVYGEDTRLSLSILNYVQYFLLGFLLADIFLTDWRERPSRHWGFDLASLAGWPLLYVIWVRDQQAASHGPLWQGLAAAATLGLFFVLFCALFRGVLTNRLISNPWLTTIGGMCYSIYLLHNPLILMAGKVTQRIMAPGSFVGSLLIQMVLLTPMVLVVSAMYFAAIEKPCMQKDWPQKLWAWLRGGSKKGEETDQVLIEAPAAPAAQQKVA